MVGDGVAVVDVVPRWRVWSAIREGQRGWDAVDARVGYGYLAAIEEGDDAEVRAMFEANFFGLVAMINAVLPGMRARRSA